MKKRKRLRPWVRNVLNALVVTIFALIGAVALCCLFFAAALQESERLTPLSEEEIAEKAEPVWFHGCE